jgi:colanic acid biosynthesis glycosyl transferase WcaI
MWKAPVFFHIQDIVPDAGVATGMLKERGAAIVLARRLERFVYSKASMIGVICDGFKLNLLAKGIPLNKVVILPDYIDLDFMRLYDRNNSFRLEHGIGPNDFVVMYSGSIGLKQGLETLVEAASELRNYKDILFIILGEGPSLSELKSRAKQLNLGNLRFLPLQPRDRLPLQLAAADVLVITQRREMTAHVFPGKLLYYMAASRPILAAVNLDSETGRFVQRKQVGLVVPPENPKALAKAILDLRQGRGLSFGENGRRLVGTQFDRRIVLEMFLKQLKVLAGQIE